MTFDVELDIYTDGSCLMSDPERPGGWGYAIYARTDTQNKLVVDGSGSASNTTNNKMELMAIVHAFNIITKLRLLDGIDELLDVKINVYTDSKWVIGCLTNSDWACTKNAVMRKTLERFMSIYKVVFKWVKGHSSDSRNNKAHNLAEMEMRKQHDKNK